MIPGTVASARTPDVWASDSFNRANGALTGSNSDSALGGSAYAWTSTASLVVDTNSVKRTAAATQAASVAPTSLPADVMVSMTVTEIPVDGGSVTVGVMARVGSTAATPDCYSARVSATKQLVLVKIVSAASTTLSSTGNNAVVAGDIISVRCVGSTIQALLNGAIRLTATDTAIASGARAGIRCSGSGSEGRGDSWVVESA